MNAGNAMRERVEEALRRYFVDHTGFGTVDDEGNVSAYYGQNWVSLSTAKIADAILALPLDGRAGKYITVPIDPTEWMRAEGMRAHMTALYRGKKAVNEGMDDGLAAVDAIWPAMLRAYAPTAIRKLSPGEGS